MIMENADSKIIQPGVLVPDNKIVQPGVWVPDMKLITESEEIRRESEWLRKKSGYDGRRPTDLGIDAYIHSSKLHPKFFEARNPPAVPLDSLENIEWYEEQLRRAVHGFEYRGQRITGDHYWFLNFFPFLVAKLDKKGKITNEFEVDFAYYAGMHDYVHKSIEQAQYEGKGFLWMSGRGSGKDLPDSEIVITPTGPVENGTLKVNDYVIGSDGKPTRILGVFPQGTKDIYKITLRDGREIRCGLEHLWTVLDSHHRLKTLTTQQMLGSYVNKYDNHADVYKYSIPTGMGADYNEVALPVDPYVLGLLLGDGTFRKCSPAIVIADGEEEISIEVKKRLGDKYKYGMYQGKGCSWFHIGTGHLKGKSDTKNNNLLRTSLNDIGLWNVLGRDKFIPKQYFISSRTQRLELLQGLMDSDGYCSKKGKIEFSNTSRELALNVITLTRSLGIKTTLGIDTAKENSMPLYRVRLFTTLPVFRLKRKLLRMNLTPNKQQKSFMEWTPIVKIESLGYKESSTCISVEAKDNLYLTTDFTLTHNTYLVLSILSKIYHLKPNSHCMVSASNSGHATESFTKLLQAIGSLNVVHPTLALHRLQDTKSLIEAGQEVIRDGIKYKEGSMARLQKVVYGDNSGATRGSRPDAQLMEEVGDWSTGKADLKSCIGASIGSWRVGSINKCRVFMIGTGGSVASDQIKDVFKNPDAYNLLAFKDFAPKSCFFLPADYFLGGQGWEETSVNNNVSARAFLEAERMRTKDDMEIHSKIVQEFPFTIEEVFRKSGTNNFNQRHIAEQWTRLHYEWIDRRPERGFLTWVKSPSGSIKGVKWELNPAGNIEILEHPYKGQSGKEVFTDLYVGGVDSIDQGIADSTSIKNRSSLACLIKKRIVDGKFFSQTSNIYVAKYIGRSIDVRWDYEETLKLSMYYNAKMNIEYTKIGVVNYFREAKQYHRLLKRPLVAMPSKGEKIDGLQKDHSNLIGTPASTNVIDHQDGKVKEYIEDYYGNIFFLDLLEQLRDYQREDRRKYDLVIAMGLCELADEDMFGIAARGDDSPTSDFVVFGYYNDEHGIKHFGKIQKQESQEEEAMKKPGAMSQATWIDMSGKPRFDDNFEIGDADDLPVSSQSQI